MKTILFVLALSFPIALNGAPLTKSTFTEVINQVSILASTTQAAKRAKLRDVVEAPDSVRTGSRSRAELTAPDQTVTRVGANTVFSFTSTGRTYDLKKGSLLFQSPKGKGGGTIKSGGASAAVLGTTLMVAATPDGGFKVIMLEGRGKVVLPTGKSTTLKAGQMVFVLPDGQGFSGVIDIHLEKLVAGSFLVNGFSKPLPSLALIEKAIAKQNRLIARGDAVETGRTVDQVHSARVVPLIDNTNQQVVIPPLPAIPRRQQDDFPNEFLNGSPIDSP